ncbi:MAG: cellulose biosynthesis protein BcsG [Gammaproteobacteria bacterium]|nr:MAG: cellulose biosynthesis protein BcsG [Gammaproteobacteria bacterium]
MDPSRFRTGPMMTEHVVDTEVKTTAAADPDVAPSEQKEMPCAPTPSNGLGAWNLYFLLKFVLVWRGQLDFHPLENLAFAAFLLVPIRSRLLRHLRNLLALFLGIALFYHDTWLPSPDTLLTKLDALAGFSGQYLLELALRLVNLRLVSLLVLVWVGYVFLSRYLRIGVLTMGVLIAMAVADVVATPRTSIPGAPETSADGSSCVDDAASPPTQVPPHRGDIQAILYQELDDFRRTERERRVPFPSGTVPTFDLLLLHICSLSWDDLEWAGLTEHPLLAQFDMLFTRFNSASSYSGPAAIRLLRANCGQPSHHDLYFPAPNDCYLFENLRRAGFDTDLYLNHDGRYGNFLTNAVQQYGGWKSAPASIDDTPIQQHAFDGTPIHDDLGVLSRWLAHRTENTGPSATYYNTISLHDGNRLVGSGARLDSLSNYAIRLRRLLDNLLAFFQKLEKSGHRTVVVMVPEHGAAVRGDRIQLAGLREIPSPAITLVPAGIRFFGFGIEHDRQKRIQQPVSYLAISELIRRVIDHSAAQPTQPLDLVSLAQDLPETRFVSENEEVVVMRHHGQYYLRLEDRQWTPY